MLKATAPILSGWLALLLSFSANWAAAGPGDAVLFLSPRAWARPREHLPIPPRMIAGSRPPTCCGGRVGRCGTTTWQPRMR